MSHRFITVIGNIASGKSTITRLLAQTLNADLIQADEFYKTNPFFQDAVVDRSRWSLASDIWFLMKRVEMAKQIETLLLSKDVVQDSGLLMSWVYANSRLEAGYMNHNETTLYNLLYENLTKNVPRESLVVFLNLPVPVLQQRIKQRQREFELKYHSPTYLDGLQKSLLLLKEMIIHRGIRLFEYTNCSDTHPSQIVHAIVTDIREAGNG